MKLLQALVRALAGLLDRSQGVRDHTKQQAYGPRWSQRRKRRIDPYLIKRPHRNWR